MGLCRKNGTYGHYNAIHIYIYIYACSGHLIDILFHLVSLADKFTQVPHKEDFLNNIDKN